MEGAYAQPRPRVGPAGAFRSGSGVTGYLREVVRALAFIALALVAAGIAVAIALRSHGGSDADTQPTAPRLRTAHPQGALIAHGRAMPIRLVERAGAEL